MNPGRALDKRIAEQIMGFEVEETDDCNGVDNYWLKNQFHWGEGVGLPCYSTNIKEAWEIFERLIWDSFSLKLTYDKISNWSFWVNERCLVSFITTAPHAICLGALKLKEEVK